MKTLEKKVHFKAEGTSIGCYDSKGNPMRYILIAGEPYIEIKKSVDRFLDIETARVHNADLEYQRNYRSDLTSCVHLKGVINGTFISSKNSHWQYAERSCSNAELASYYLAKYKAYKNAIKMEVKNG